MHPLWRSAAWIAGLGGAGVGAYFSLRAVGVVGELPRASGGDFLVNNLTLTSTKTDFVSAIVGAAANARPTMSPTSRGLLAAWAALESNWGKSKQALLGFNMWNVGRGSWTGPTLLGGDTEYTPGSASLVKITQRWRQYATMEAAISDLLSLLQNSRYINYPEAYADLMAGNELFATRLGVLDKVNGVVARVDNRPNTAGYYTLPRSEYQRSISKLWQEVRLVMANASLSGTKLSGVKLPGPKV